MNSAGRSSSPWTNGRTGPAPPEDVGPPRFLRVSATSAVVHIHPPARPNGIVSLYRVFSLDHHNRTLVNLQSVVSQLHLHSKTHLCLSLLALRRHIPSADASRFTTLHPVLDRSRGLHLLPGNSDGADAHHQGQSKVTGAYFEGSALSNQGFLFTVCSCVVCVASVLQPGSLERAPHDGCPPGPAAPPSPRLSDLPLCPAELDRAFGTQRRHREVSRSRATCRIRGILTRAVSPSSAVSCTSARPARSRPSPWPFLVPKAR